ncbi:glycine zipper 2TM domain-containing protein [Duganella sp. FT80W]|uniref:Glycine zipper 2TM domain-containing protein n=1 Tax=Duganella guangzhouensis TaxID=2666084 RepID=A0A6I2KYJ4_9BURK|nr:glycine zipper 2TM domain-containing protein [Duganella guangzhouensis]MRW91225.1 glycine zipper 2TM domain-containing protein [Duganella guangzhouensis]
MTHRTLAALLLVAIAASAQAQTPKEQFDAETKRVATRYADDKKLCGDEQDSGRRMQCLRDSKGEYDKAMTQARAQYKAGPSRAGTCHECGKVTQVSVNEKAGESSALGLIAGGVAGAVLGNQVGSGHGRQLATVAGAAGGAYAGKKIEEKAKSSKQWTVHVQYDDGKQASYTFDHDPKMLSGDRVQKANGSIVRH